jgi:signal transduction histidine kinase
MRVMRSLSGRLLFLTIVFVMLAEVLIFAPSLARFRVDYLRERLAASNIVAVALLDQERSIGDDHEMTLLESAEVRSIALQRGGARLPILRGNWADPVNETYDLDDSSILGEVWEGFAVLFRNDPSRVIRVMGSPDATRNPMGEKIEVTLRENQMRDAMVAFGLRILAVSLIISLLTAGLVFLSLNRWLVRPIRKVTSNMIEFRKAPEAAAIINPDRGRNEIAVAQAELAAMQTELRGALKQKTRLAGLGEAVAKINHDLRNILTTAHLLTDRLESSADPMVSRVAPKLLRSLDRATALCERTLEFGRAEELQPERLRVMMPDFLEEVRDQLMLAHAEDIRVGIDVDDGTFVEADPDQLYRIIYNIARNAAQALEATGKGGMVTLSARRLDAGAEIDVIDDGPGMPMVARENLFKAFKGGVRKGGTGLGLVIAQELARGHGGDVRLIDSTTDGTCFRITIPDTANGA